MSRRVRIIHPPLVLAAIVLVQGCSSAFSGLDATSGFSCKAPEGVQCDSVSGNYYNAIQNNLPSQRTAPSAPAANLPTRSFPPSTATTSAPAKMSTRTSPAGEDAVHAVPLRAAPRVLRLWIKSWEDSDRDLVGESLIYVQVDNGRWLVDHVQRQQRDAFAPLRAPRVPTTAPRSAAALPAGSAGQTANAAEESASITQALRAFQGRAQAANED